MIQFSTMRIALGTVLCLLMAASLGLPTQEPPKKVRISAGVAEGLIVKKVEPVYPEMARIARIQGRVVLSVLLSTGGRIENIKAISGHPILIQAAIDAVRQWQYRPFLLNGQPVEVDTIAEVRFFLGSKEEAAKWEAALHTFRGQEQRCRTLVSQRVLAEAESSCATLPELSEKLEPELVDERIIAYRDLGSAFFAESKFQEALTAFARELEIAEGKFDPNDLELARAHVDAAHARQALGDLEQASSDFQQAVEIFDYKLEEQVSDFKRTQSARELRRVLLDYAKLLRQMERVPDAEAMEQRAQTLPADNLPQK